jgi:hypothetical protein
MIGPRSQGKTLQHVMPEHRLFEHRLFEHSKKLESAELLKSTGPRKLTQMPVAAESQR